MSRRAQIALGRDEIRRFLDERKTIIVCSIGRDGVPHPMPMWHAVEADGAVVMTTFTKSQKVRNLERDPRVSLLVEDGELYSELRGVVLYGTAEIERDPDRVVEVLTHVSARRRESAGADAQAMREALRAQARKRVALRIHPERVISWDHRKLGGVY